MASARSYSRMARPTRAMPTTRARWSSSIATTTPTSRQSRVKTQQIPLFVTQQQTAPGDNTTTASLVAQWKIGVRPSGRGRLRGPEISVCVRERSYSSRCPRLRPARRKIRRGVLREGGRRSRLAAPAARVGESHRGPRCHRAVSRSRPAARLGLRVVPAPLTRPPTPHGRRAAASRSRIRAASKPSIPS